MGTLGNFPRMILEVYIGLVDLENKKTSRIIDEGGERTVPIEFSSLKNEPRVGETKRESYSNNFST